jgi:hypothetical protein
MSESEVKVFYPPERRLTLFHDLLKGLTENSSPSRGLIELTKLISALPFVKK